MDIAPLALVMLLGYGLLIAVALTTWTAVAYFREEPEAETPPGETKRARPVQEQHRHKRQVSNDEVRGARSRRARIGGDPFQSETVGVAPSGNGSEPVEPGGSGEPVSWTRETSAPAKRQNDSSRSGSKDAGAEEDAFERFLSSKPDDFDIR